MSTDMNQEQWNATVEQGKRLVAEGRMSKAIFQSLKKGMTEDEAVKLTEAINDAPPSDQPHDEWAEFRAHKSPVIPWPVDEPTEHEGFFPAGCPLCNFYITKVTALGDRDYTGRNHGKREQSRISDEHIRWAGKQDWPTDEDAPGEWSAPVDDPWAVA